MAVAQPIVSGPLAAPLRLYLIRHGETDWSLASKHTSYTNIALNAQGKGDAQKLGEKLHASGFNRVFTSPSQRARSTCTLAELTPVADIEPALAEWDYGDYEGQRSVDIQKHRTHWNLFQDGCPQGESPAQVSDRADLLIARLRELNGNIALFTHGQFGSVLVVRWIGLSVMTAQHFPLGTASVSILGYSRNHPELPVIESLSVH
jgi:probable phosphoglycerate mutase